MSLSMVYKKENCIKVKGGFIAYGFINYISKDLKIFLKDVYNISDLNDVNFRIDKPYKDDYESGIYSVLIDDTICNKVYNPIQFDKIIICDTKKHKAYLIDRFN